MHLIWQFYGQKIHSICMNRSHVCFTTKILHSKSSSMSSASLPKAAWASRDFWQSWTCERVSPVLGFENHNLSHIHQCKPKVIPLLCALKCHLFWLQIYTYVGKIKIWTNLYIVGVMSMNEFFNTYYQIPSSWFLKTVSSNQSQCNWLFRKKTILGVVIKYIPKWMYSVQLTIKWSNDPIH